MAAPKKSLKTRAIHSSLWVGSGHILSQLIRLLSNLLLTRLLVPEMFGLMAIVSVILIGLVMISDVGFMQNVVQSNRSEEKKYLDTAWSLQLLSGGAVFVLAQLSSLLLLWGNKAAFFDSNTVYGDANLPIVLSVMSFTALISGANSIYLHVLVKRLEFKKIVITEIVSQLSGLVIMIYIAWQYQTIWALVIGAIISSSVKMALSHLPCITPKRVSFRIDKTSLIEILNFGKWIIPASILGFLLNQGDRLLLGGVMSPTELGVYTIAFFLASAPKAILAKLISSVFFPVLSETVRKKPDELEKVYYNIKNKIDILTFFSAGILVSTGTLIVTVLYDDRYLEAGWMLQLLAASLPTVGYMLCEQCFLANGNSKVTTFIIALQVITLFAFTPILYSYFGLLGALISVAFNPYVRVISSILLMRKHFFFNLSREVTGIPFFIVGFVLGEIVLSIF